MRQTDTNQKIFFSYFLNEKKKFLNRLLVRKYKLVMSDNRSQYASLPTTEDRYKIRKLECCQKYHAVCVIHALFQILCPPVGETKNTLMDELK